MKYVVKMEKMKRAFAAPEGYDGKCHHLTSLISKLCRLWLPKLSVRYLVLGAIKHEGTATRSNSNGVQGHRSTSIRLSSKGHQPK